jgi:hypothetical protein
MNTNVYDARTSLSYPTERRFGRLRAPDPGDMDFPLEKRLSAMRGVEARRRTQAPRRGPILDQGATNRCVMFSIAACLGAYPVYAKDAAAAIQRVSIPLDGDPDLYRWACNHDEFNDNDHGEDLGTSCRAGQEYTRRVGLSSAYYHARNPEVAKDYISRNGSTPLQAGFDWWSSFDRPNRQGVVETVDGSILGGHAFCVLWFSKTTGLWKCQNSWGPDWGLGGIFYMPEDVFDYVAFQTGGDLIAFTEVR